MINLADSTASTNPLLPSWPEFIIGTILFALVFGFLARLALPRIQQTLAERTRRLIAIAHPDFQEELDRAAHTIRQRGF